VITFDYSGQVALVTGGARGLGFATAKALHDAGASVAVNDRDAAGVDGAIRRLGGGPRLASAPADLASSAGCERAVRQAVDAFGRLDLLVNNAAVNIEKPIEETDEAHWDLHLAVVLKAPFFCCRAARRRGRDRRWQSGGAPMTGCDFTGSRVLVTGSTRGIGRAAAELFHARGAEVILHGRRAEDAFRAAAALGARRAPDGPGASADASSGSLRTAASTARSRCRWRA
jgi:NAD(P)-dependent dehydrogenase (short-subunit alcohol dehydrogenase family)